MAKVVIIQRRPRISGDAPLDPAVELKAGFRFFSSTAFFASLTALPSGVGDALAVTSAACNGAENTGVKAAQAIKATATPRFSIFIF